MAYQPICTNITPPMDVGNKILQGLIKSSILSAGMRKLKKWGAQNASWTPKGGYGSRGRLRTSRTSRTKKGGLSRPSFRAKGYARRSTMGFRGSARGRSSKKAQKGRVQKSRILAASEAVAMDRFHERLSSLIQPSLTSTDTQQITIGSGSGGIDLRFLKNIKETIFDDLAANDPQRILIYNYVRTITLMSLANNSTQEVEIIRWRPRFDTDETPIQTFAFASSSGTDYKKPQLTVIGATLFDSRVWVTNYKAIKKYVRRLKPGRGLKMRFKRTFKQPKVIDYLGQFYYTLSARPGGTFSDYFCMQRANLTEVITYRLLGTSVVGIVAPDRAATSRPGVWIQDESECHYLRATASNISKSSYESFFSSTAQTGMTGAGALGISDGYTSVDIQRSVFGSL